MSDIETNQRNKEATDKLVMPQAEDTAQPNSTDDATNKQNKSEVQRPSPDENSFIATPPEAPLAEESQLGTSGVGVTGASANVGAVSDEALRQNVVLPRLDTLEGVAASTDANQNDINAQENQGYEQNTPGVVLQPIDKVVVRSESTGEKIEVKEDQQGNQISKKQLDLPSDKNTNVKESSTPIDTERPKVDNVFTAKTLDPEPVRPDSKFGSDNFSKAPTEPAKPEPKTYSTEQTGNKSSTPEQTKPNPYKPESTKPIDSPPRVTEPAYKDQPSPATTPTNATNTADTARPSTQTSDSQPAQLKSNEQPTRVVTNEPASKATTPTPSEVRTDRPPAATPEAAPQRLSEQKSEPKAVVDERKSTQPSENHKSEVPQPKIITKGDLPKSVESVKTDNVALNAKIKDLVQQITSTNTKDIVRVQAKEELVKIVENAVKKATFEGKSADLIQVIKQIIAEPVIKDSIRIVTGSTGDNHSIKELKALLDQVVAIRNKGDVAQKLELNTATVKRIEDIQGPVISKEAALSALIGILVDADKITSRLVKEVQIETASKISQIQSTVDELIKLRVEQFISLSVKGYGVDGTTFKVLCQEAITELANRYGLNDQQRALLNQLLIQISESDFSAGTPTTTDKDKSVDPKQKEIIDPNKRELTPKEIEALFQKEVETLEAFLKEREEIKRAKAEAELVNLLAEVIDETMSYKIDEDLEVIKVFTIKGIVVHHKTRVPIAGVKIYAGILGMFETDQDGQFVIRNVPQLTRYIIGADHSEYIFTPPYHSGTIDTSVEIVFEATSSSL